MSDFCQAFPLATLRRFPGWTASADGDDDLEVAYLGSDLVVRGSATDPDRVVFADDSPGWRAFCCDELGFRALTFPEPGPFAGAGSDGEPVPFVPGQRWLLEEMDAARPRHFHTPFRIPIDVRPEPARLQEVLGVLLSRHDALRLRLDRVDGRWVQTVSREPHVPLTWVRLAGIPPREVERLQVEMVVDASRLMQRVGQPMARFVYVECDGGDALCALFGHFVLDGVSTVLLSGDLRRLLGQVARREAPRLPPTTASFERWARRVADFAASPEAERELHAYWARLPWDRIAWMPLDFPEGLVRDPVSGRDGYGTGGSEAWVTASLDAGETTRWLATASDADPEERLADLLLTALGLAFERLTGSPVLHLGWMDSNREPIFEGISLLRTVGYVSHGRRLLLDLGGSRTPEEALASVRAQLRAMPNRGRGLEWMLRRGDGSPAPEALRHVPRRVDLIMNYLGWLDHWVQLSAPMDLPEVKAVNDRGYRNHPLLGDAAVVEGRFMLRFAYSTEIHRTETIQTLANDCVEALGGLIRTTIPPGGEA